MGKEFLIEKLERCKIEIDVWETQEVTVRDSAEFEGWGERVLKWLKLGGAATSEEFAQFHYLDFCVQRLREEGEGYFPDDQQQYLKDLKRARQIVDSAIENLQHGLQYDSPREKEKKGRSSGVNIGSARDVIVADQALVNTVNSMTVSDFMGVIRREIENLPESPEKRPLIQRLTDILKNPVFTSLASTTIGELIKKFRGAIDQSLQDEG